MLKVGQVAPDFTLPASDGTNVSLSQFKGKTVVLYFYPKDSTPGCTTEACNFRNDFQLYNQKNAVILGVSKDSLKSHQNFIAKEGLPFLLLSDIDTQVMQLYDAWREKKVCGKVSVGTVRSTFIIGPDRKIKEIFDSVKVNGHSKKVLETL